MATCGYEPNIDTIVHGAVTFIAVGQIPKNWLQAPTNAKGIPLSVLTVPSGDDISSDNPHASAQEGDQFPP